MDSVQKIAAAGRQVRPDTWTIQGPVDRARRRIDGDNFIKNAVGIPKKPAKEGQTTELGTFDGDLA